MQRNSKSFWGLLFVLMGVFLLGACSSNPSTPVSTTVEASLILPQTETPTVEILIEELPTLTETSQPAPTKISDESGTATPTAVPTAIPTDVMSSPELADVITVSVSGNEGAYQFSVEIRSPDTGCEQYADWWEVVSHEGDLVYRRILTHSHVTEQPFTRSGGPVAISADTIVIVRAHMYPEGYGGEVLKGSVEEGFEVIQLEEGFAAGLETVDPQPSGCGF